MSPAASPADSKPAIGSELRSKKGRETMTGALFTWGYQGSKPADLLAICRRLGITHVVDCRARPQSRIPGFGGNQLRALFASWYEGGPTDDGRPVPVYTQRGHDMGGVSASMTMPADGPPALADRVFEDLHLEACVRGARLLLICAEHAPGDCHRHMTIALPLAKMARDRPGWWPAEVPIRHVFEGTLIDPLELQRSIDDPDPEAEYECEEIEDAASAAGAGVSP